MTLAFLIKILKNALKQNALLFDMQTDVINYVKTDFITDITGLFLKKIIILL